jgi:hypothetical protein
MATPDSCCSPCSTTPPVNVPGSQGPQGIPGPSINPQPQSAGYGGANPYVLTTALATITPTGAGAVIPQVTLPTAGTWLIMGRVQTIGNGSTYAAGAVLTIAAARTNNTPATLTSETYTMPALTTSSASVEDMSINPTFYITANASDVIALQAGMSVGTTGGATPPLQVSSASIAAYRIF